MSKNLKEALEQYKKANEELKKELLIIFDPFLSFLAKHTWILWTILWFLIFCMIVGLFSIGVVE